MHRNLIPRALLAALPLIAALMAAAPAAEAVEVKSEATLARPAAKVWAMVGEFGALDTWHPAVVKAEVDGDGGSGIYRNLTLGGDGGTIRELLLDYSLNGRTYSYAIVEGPLPVANYVSRLAVLPGPEPDSSIIRWTSTFDANGVSDDEAAKLIGGIYQAGFDNLAKMLAAQ